ncbi:fliB family protein [Clostridium sp. CAG:221]|uniref:flagellin lysine-N-methylase n=1 Tax=Clostridium sp. CAG:221 TaxID=1262780 RepID=UPI00033C516C|nr:flagellin lysine-N-methylase [Clostridium sp. CAG:221]CDB15127.1 fliB family protein [Clostridium sp. CAG:221]
MKIRVPEYFKDFKCIASKCEDTCCAGWGIVIDDATYDRYKNVQGEFGDRLRSEIVHEAGENIFVLKGNNCPFLNEEKTCDIYINIGEENLCYTCQQYPRYTEEFGSLREVGISLSCPEAARIMLNNSKKVEFELSENNEVVSSYNDINAQLFIELLQSRKIVMDIIQDRTIDLRKRAVVALLFVDEIQEKIDESEIKEIKSVREKYLDKGFLEELINELEEYRDNEGSKYDDMHEYFKVFKDLKHITPDDPLGLNDALRYFWQTDEDEELYIIKHRQFEEYYKDKLYKFENILVYFVFRYFMKAVFDYDILAKIKTALVSYMIIRELAVVRYIENNEFTDEDMVDIAHTYSKDIEHLEENIEALSELFETNDVFDIEEMVIALMN